MTFDVHLVLGGVGLAVYVAALHWAVRPLKDSARAAHERRSQESLHALGQLQGSSMDDIQYKFFGALYGFPSCCVDAFCTSYCRDTHDRYPTGPWLGTGFIPCISCAPSAALNFDQFVAKRIARNRICPLPFPSELSSTTYDAAFSLIAELEIDAIEAAKPLLRQKESYLHAHQA